MTFQDWLLIVLAVALGGALVPVFQVILMALAMMVGIDLNESGK